VRLVARIRAQWGVELRIRDIFEAEHLSALAALIEQNSGQMARPPIVALDWRPISCPLPSRSSGCGSSIIWGGGSVQYNMPGALRIHGRFEEETAEQALVRIIRRHEPLRTVFSTESRVRCSGYDRFLISV